MPFAASSWRMTPSQRIIAAACSAARLADSSAVDRTSWDAATDRERDTSLMPAAAAVRILGHRVSTSVTGRNLRVRAMTVKMAVRDAGAWMLDRIPDRYLATVRKHYAETAHDSPAARMSAAALSILRYRHIDPSVAVFALPDAP